MKRIFSILMAVCLVFGMTVPAMAAGTDILPDTPTSESGEPASETTPDLPTETPATPTDSLPEEAPDGSAETVPTDDADLPSLGESCDTSTIQPLSEWDGEENEFYTKIRLTVTDRSGDPIAGAVYGLYRAEDDFLVEYLTTDSFGVAVSEVLPVLEQGYYLLEQTAPDGYVLSDEKIPAIVVDGETVEITVTNKAEEPETPKTGKLLLIKKSESGDALESAVFGVYEADTDKKVALPPK